MFSADLVKEECCVEYCWGKGFLGNIQILSLPLQVSEQFLEENCTLNSCFCLMLEFEKMNDSFYMESPIMVKYLHVCQTLKPL